MFQPYKAKPKMLIQRADNENDPHYKCVSVCADNLLIASKLVQTIMDTLMNKHEFKLKGARLLSCHLGCDFALDGNNNLCSAPCECIEKMSDSCM